MTATDDRTAIDALLMVTAEDIDTIPWTGVPTCKGVREKVLWRFGSFVQALISYEPGASTPGSSHLAAHHHIWVVSGSASIAGKQLTQGSYVHVPPDIEHPIVADARTGCVLLQMHRPHPMQEALTP